MEKKEYVSQLSQFQNAYAGRVDHQIIRKKAIDFLSQEQSECTQI